LTKIYGNTANYGGGLALSADSATIDQCLIMDNEATGFGGGIYAWKSATISNSSIVYNTAGAKGGGVALRDQTLTIVNSTISGQFGGQRRGRAVYQ